MTELCFSHSTLTWQECQVSFDANGDGYVDPEELQALTGAKSPR